MAVPTQPMTTTVCFERDIISIAGRYCKFSRTLPQSPWTAVPYAPKCPGNSVCLLNFILNSNFYSFLIGINIMFSTFFDFLVFTFFKMFRFPRRSATYWRSIFARTSHVLCLVAGRISMSECWASFFSKITRVSQKYCNMFWVFFAHVYSLDFYFNRNSHCRDRSPICCPIDKCS